MYSNFNFQFLKISSIFLIHHNGITNSSVAPQQHLNIPRWGRVPPPLDSLSVSPRWGRVPPPLNSLSISPRWGRVPPPLNSLSISRVGGGFPHLSIASQYPALGAGSPTSQQPLNHISIIIIKILRLTEQLLRH